MNPSHARAFLDAIWTTNANIKDEALRNALLQQILHAYETLSRAALAPVPGFDQVHFEEALSPVHRQ